MRYFFGIKDLPVSIVQSYIDAKKNDNIYEIIVDGYVLRAMKDLSGYIIFDFIGQIGLKFFIVAEHEIYARLKFESAEVL